jgi:hypothetical protein
VTAADRDPGRHVGSGDEALVRFAAVAVGHSDRVRHLVGPLDAVAADATPPGAFAPVMRLGLPAAPSTLALLILWPMLSAQ